MVSTFICDGSGPQEYPDFRKVEIDDDGRYIVKSRRIIRVRLSMGTIVGNPVLWVKFRGKGIGTVEKYFVSGIRKVMCLVCWSTAAVGSLHDNTVFVKNTKRKTGKTPAWAGGRIPLSSQMSECYYASCMKRPVKSFYRRGTHSDGQFLIINASSGDLRE